MVKMKMTFLFLGDFAAERGEAFALFAVIYASKGV
jgi:hypothetical protein